MKQVIPSASGDSFDVVYQVTDDGELRRADLTGVFYPDSAPMTYTVDFTDYGSTPTITAP
jgi:lipoprotein LprG